MVPLNTVFWGMVFLFGMIGAMRGWAKEIMVTCGILLALFVQQVVGQFVLGPQNPYLPMLLHVSPDVPAPAVYDKTQFTICTVVLFVLTFFGYAGPTLAARGGASMARERLQEGLLGFFIGLLNGYMLFGTLWFYLDKNQYTFGGIIPPIEGSTAWTVAHNYLLPLWFTTPMLFVAVALAFIFVIIAFI